MKKLGVPVQPVRESQSGACGHCADQKFQMFLDD